MSNQSDQNKENEISPISKTEDVASVAQLNPKTPVKPIKIEDKPFKDFIKNDLIPGLYDSLQESGLKEVHLSLEQGERPVVGGNCWMLIGQIDNRRRFWVCFADEKINSVKTIALAETGTDPSLLESFLVDERKITMPLLISRVLQRLNGQKWLGAN